MSDTTNVISIRELNVEPGSGYMATLVQSFVQPESSISRAPRDNDAPMATNVAIGLYVCFLTIVVLDAPPDDVDARRRALMRALDPLRGPLALVIENPEGTPRRRYMPMVARATQQIENQFGRGFAVTLESSDDVRWRSTAAVEQVWTIDESGTRSLTVAGDLEVAPVYTVTPNSGKSTANWPYSRLILIEWRSPLGGSHPIDITGGGLNTAALLTAGHINDESNMAVVMNGVLRRHFYSDPVASPAYTFGTGETRIWIDMEFTPAAYPVLANYVSAMDTTWPVWDDGGLPPSGTLRVGSELVSYTSRAPGYLYGVVRGRYGTTAAEHQKWSDVTHYQGVGWLLYGPAAVAPDAMKYAAYRAAVEPMNVHGSSSSNAVWKYEMFGRRGAPVSWSFNSYLNNLAYTEESDANGAYTETISDPWQAIGLQAGWTSLSTYTLRLAIPIKMVQMVGRRMVRVSPAVAPNAPVLSALSDDQRQRVTVWRAGDGAGREANVWFSVDSADIRPAPFTPAAATAGYNRLQWAVSQSSHLQADIAAMWITFDPDYLPVVSLGAVQTEYDLDLTLTNTTTGESITVQFANLAEGESLVIDSQWQTVTYSLDGSNQYTTVRRDAPRPRFLQLVPGVNNFQISEAGMGELEIKVAYRPRWYA